MQLILFLIYLPMWQIFVEWLVSVYDFLKEIYAIKYITVPDVKEFAF